MTFLANHDEAFMAVLNFVDAFPANDELPEIIEVGNVLADNEKIELDEMDMAAFVTHYNNLEDRIESHVDSASNNVNAKKKLPLNAREYDNFDHGVEIAYMREKAEELEKMLQSLRQQSTGLNEGIMRVEETVPSLWKDIALRERNERDLTELENMRLKCTVISRIKAAKKLKSTLLKQIQKEIAECSVSIQRRVDMVCPSGEALDIGSDASDFQDLLKYLDDAYSQLNAVLATNGLAWKEPTQQGVQMRKGVHGMYFEVFSNKILPFGLDVKAKATWNYFKGLKKHRGTLYAKEARVQRNSAKFKGAVVMNCFSWTES
ncbi:hypothetical protein PsorP6_004524 [Peronosclerospora sorghi]|uniref:Uncharacterized protein n=1 Tax=Peronosclerospora sorghi TaxID=230839 RepID=A0ACC0VND3_9STRA|nr:hypothetical protein PsorP6_004524 [Peronosclerospora sorghi]